jgi:hypothetical protein
MSAQPRLAAHIVAGAILRQTMAQGDFAAVLKKGDLISGSILLSCLIKGKNPVVYERLISVDNVSAWHKIMTIESPTQGDVDAYLKRRTDRDPDLWLIELDTADTERLTRIIAE